MTAILLYLDSNKGFLFIHFTAPFILELVIHVLIIILCLVARYYACTLVGYSKPTCDSFHSWSQVVPVVFEESGEDLFAKPISEECFVEDKRREGGMVC